MQNLMNLAISVFVLLVAFVIVPDMRDRIEELEQKHDQPITEQQAKEGKCNE